MKTKFEDMSEIELRRLLSERNEEETRKMISQYRASFGHFLSLALGREVTDEEILSEIKISLGMKKYYPPQEQNPE